jgi:hypothetical protein
VNVKNITGTVDEGLYRRARLCAAEQNTSITSVVRNYLKSFCERESEFEKRERLERETLSRFMERGGSFSASARLTREKIQQRHTVS